MDAWAAAAAKAIPASGDGVAGLCRHLAERSKLDEPSVATVQRIFDQIQTSRVSCHLLVIGEDDCAEA
eukprot:1155998-Lingulodinium_polyedra.AAC.1